MSALRAASRAANSVMSSDEDLADGNISFCSSLAGCLTCSDSTATWVSVSSSSSSGWGSRPFCQCMNSANKMMIGMGMPRNRSSSERMRAPDGVGWEQSQVGRVGRVGLVGHADQAGQASRRWPPKVADKLATKAPSSSDTNSHSAL